MFQFTPADIAEQLRSLPPVFFVYLRILGMLNLSSLFFVRRVQACWVLAAMLFIVATNVPLFLSMGLVKAGSIPHLIVWVPLIAYLAAQFRSGHLDVRRPFGMWCFAVMLADLVSVVFDVRDSVQWFLGDRLPAPQNIATELPVPTLIVIGLSLLAVSAYSLGFPRRDAETTAG